MKKIPPLGGPSAEFESKGRPRAVIVAPIEVSEPLSSELRAAGWDTAAPRGPSGIVAALSAARGIVIDFRSDVPAEVVSAVASSRNGRVFVAIGDAALSVLHAPDVLLAPPVESGALARTLGIALARLDPSKSS